MIFIMEHFKNCLYFLRSSFSNLFFGAVCTFSLWLPGIFIYCSSWKGLSRVVLPHPGRGSRRLQGQNSHNGSSEGTIVSPSWAERAGKAPRFKFRIISSTSRPLKALGVSGLCLWSVGRGWAGRSGGICCLGKAVPGLPLRKGSSSVPFGSFLCYIGSMNHFPGSSFAVFKAVSSKKLISLKYTRSYFLLDVWAPIS